MNDSLIRAYELRDEWIDENNPYESLDLSYLRLREIPEDFFDGCENCRYINLNNNLLSELPPKLLYNLPNLISFSFENNFISTIPNDFFKNNLLLERVYLDENNLSVIPIEAFDCGLVPNLELFQKESFTGRFSYNTRMILQYGSERDRQLLDATSEFYYNEFNSKNPWLIPIEVDEPVNKWILRCDTLLYHNKERIIARTRTFKEELMASAWNPYTTLGRFNVLDAMEFDAIDTI